MYMVRKQGIYSAKHQHDDYIIIIKGVNKSGNDRNDD